MPGKAIRGGTLLFSFAVSATGLSQRGPWQALGSSDEAFRLRPRRPAAPWFTGISSRVRLLPQEISKRDGCDRRRPASQEPWGP